MTRETFGKAYEKGGDRTVRFLLSRGVPRDCATDFSQMAWLRGWERLGQLRDESLLGTWINTIALNCYRRSMFRDRLFNRLSDSVRAETVVDEAAIELGRIMDRCRPEDRVLLEKQLEGVTAEELAAEQGVSQVAIRVRFLRARRAARGRLGKDSSCLAAAKAA